MMAQGRYKNLILSLVDTPAEAVAAIESFK